MQISREDFDNLSEVLCQFTQAWTCRDIQTFLKFIGFSEELTDNFNSTDGRTLTELTEQDLKNEFQVTNVMARKKLVSWIKSFPNYNLYIQETMKHQQLPNIQPDFLQEEQIEYQYMDQPHQMQNQYFNQEFNEQEQVDNQNFIKQQQIEQQQLSNLQNNQFQNNNNDLQVQQQQQQQQQQQGNLNLNQNTINKQNQNQNQQGKKKPPVLPILVPDLSILQQRQQDTQIVYKLVPVKIQGKYQTIIPNDQQQVVNLHGNSYRVIFCNEIITQQQQQMQIQQQQIQQQQQQIELLKQQQMIQQKSLLEPLNLLQQKLATSSSNNESNNQEKTTDSNNDNKNNTSDSNVNEVKNQQNQNDNQQNTHKQQSHKQPKYKLKQIQQNIDSSNNQQSPNSYYNNNPQKYVKKSEGNNNDKKQQSQNIYQPKKQQQQNIVYNKLSVNIQMPGQEEYKQGQGVQYLNLDKNKETYVCRDYGIPKNKFFHLQNEGNDITTLSFNQTNMSKQHAKIVHENGQFLIQDLGSNLGTEILINKKSLPFKISNHQIYVFEFKGAQFIINITNISKNDKSITIHYDKYIRGQERKQSHNQQFEFKQNGDTQLIKQPIGFKRIGDGIFLNLLDNDKEWDNKYDLWQLLSLPKQQSEKIVIVQDDIIRFGNVITFECKLKQ